MAETDEMLGVEMGEAVYGGDGNRVSTVRGFDGQCFYVTTEAGVRALSAGPVTTNGRRGT